MGTKPSVKVGQVWSCGDGDIEVLEYLSCKEVKVRFLSTGYERWTWAQSIKKGHVKDRVKAQLDIESRVNVDRKLSVMYEALYAKKRFEEHEQIFKDSNMHLYKHIVKNSVWPTNSYGKIRIIKEVDGFRVTVYFLNTGYTRVASKSSIVKGRVVDYKCKYLPKFKRPNKILPSEEWIYSRWCGMMNRCYNQDEPSYKSYGAKGVYVIEHWHRYENYREWFIENTPGRDYDVDSDLRNQAGQKHYSPEGCTFLPPALNSALAGEFINNKTWPVGVDLHKVSGKFRARYRKVSMEKVRERIVIGYYHNPVEAGHAYADAREMAIKSLAREFHKSGLIDDEVLKLFEKINLHSRVNCWEEDNPKWRFK